MDLSEFTSNYTHLSDDELLCLWADRSTLVPEASIALDTELQTRGLNRQNAIPRQRNVVFPDTTRNEARFWKDIGNPAFNTPAKIGLGLLGAWIFGLGALLVYYVTRENDGVEQLAVFALKYVLFFGPIFAAIAWATNRALRKAQRTPSRHKGQN